MKNSFKLILTVAFTFELALTQNDGYSSGSSGSYDLTGAGPEPCGQPLPIFVLAIWLPIFIPLILFGIFYGINYKRKEKTYLNKEIESWNEWEQKTSIENSLKSSIKYHGIINLNSFRSVYLDSISIDFSANFIEGAGENILGKYISEGEIKKKNPTMIQTYLVPIEDSNETLKMTLNAIFHRTQIKSWNSPWFIGICEFSRSPGILILVPKDEMKINDKKL